MSNWINTTKTAAGCTVTANAQNDLKPRSTSFNVSNGMSFSRPIIVFQSGKDSYTVQDLINWGYATYTVKNGYGVIELDVNAPFYFSRITNFDDVAKDIERINDDYQNVVVWKNGVPLCMTMEQIANWYSNNSIPIVDLSSTGISSGLFGKIDFSSLEGTFILKISTESQNLRFYTGPFITNSTSPKKFAINAENGRFDTLSGTCINMEELEEFTIRAHSLLEDESYVDYNYVTNSMSSAFQNCKSLKEITGVVCAETLSDQSMDWHYTFYHCDSLTIIKSDIAKTGTLRIKNGSGCFNSCSSLVTIEPILDFVSIRNSTSVMFAGCINLENVKIKNIDGYDYDFTSNDFQIPKMSLESMQYLITNAKEQSEERNLVFSTLHESELSSDYITAAQNKNWKITFKEV